MSTLDDYKGRLNRSNSINSIDAYDVSTMTRILKDRMRKEAGLAMRYFWASFVYQLFVYAVLFHLMIRFWYQPIILMSSIFCVAIFVPFTVILMRSFKKIAITKPSGSSMSSVYDNVKARRQLLAKFFLFKKRYEFVLIPLFTAFGVFLGFNIFLPGGIAEHFYGAAFVFIITILSCVYAIRRENRIYFREPLRKMKMILDEFEEPVNTHNID